MPHVRWLDPDSPLTATEAAVLAEAGRLWAAGVRPTGRALAAALGRSESCICHYLSRLRARGLWRFGRERRGPKGPGSGRGTPETVVGPTEAERRTALIRAAKDRRARLGRSPVLPQGELDAILPAPEGGYEQKKRQAARASRIARGLPAVCEAGELKPRPRTGPLRVYRVPVMLRGWVEEG